MPQLLPDEPEPSLALSTVRRVRSFSSTRRVTPSSAAGRFERVLLNGDIYIGGFTGSVPNGAGKYLWRDGCMYEGEWQGGKAAGKGKFSWPSGATYEGEFRAGRMEGLGAFTGSNGESYFGIWVADRKHGFGQKSYANGDFYEGMWRRNLQEGQGRYVWYNGDEYLGQWRSGVISGRGVLIWSNGNRYKGQWENGVPKGNGVFSWPDGSYYVGSWNRDPNFLLNGTFYPAEGVKEKVNSLISHLEESHNRIQSRKRLAVDGVLQGSLGDRNFSRICIWESDGEAGDITCDIIDMYRRERKMGLLDQVESRRSPCRCTRELKKPGQIISKGHKHYELMLNLQLGISYSVGKEASVVMRDLKSADFDPREKFWTRFPPEGSKITPPHQSLEFRWKDYCPLVFRHLRKLFQVDPAEYMLAICGNDALRELASPGKSGSFFYLTQDDRFMIKTVKKCEVKVLLRMLPNYYKHVCKYENSLITKFFGVHCVKSAGGQKVRFIVMGNLFCSEYRIHRRFDLKGSSHGRTTDKSEGEIDETTTLKDLDLNLVFHLQRFWHQDFIRQVEHDCEFLEAEGIMDYSLLVGVHFCDDLYAENVGMPPFITSSRRETFQGENGVCDCCFCGAKGHSMDRVLSSRKPLIRLGANMLARAEKVMRKGDSDQYQPYQSSGRELTQAPCKDCNEVILFFGIIDVLQDYDISKKLEHAYKSLHADPSSISAVDPKLYSKRFRDFINRIFIEE